MREPFGHYTLLRRLAVGGMAELFLAEHAFAAPGDARVVIKRILPHLSRDPTFVRMFIDEARLAVGLVHQNVVRTLDFGCVGEDHYLTMAHIAGVDLHRLMARCLARRQGLGLAASCALGLGLARGLGHTHRFVDADGTAQHVVHRDVSPHNVMVAASGVPMVMDFGIATAALRVTHTATGSGTVKGKLAYMAPEQARGEAATQLSDQYSLAVVLWECLAGRRLFARTDRVSQANDRAAEAPPLGRVAPQVPAPLAEVVMRALASQPHRRFATVDHLHAALADFCRHNFGEGHALHLALAAEVAAHDHDECSATRDWSWQLGPRPDATDKTKFAASGTRVVGPAGRQGGRQSSSRPRLGHRRPTPAARMPHARAHAEPGRKLTASPASCALVSARLRGRLCWFVYAAACGAAGAALWPSLTHRRGASASVAAATCCAPPAPDKKPLHGAGDARAAGEGTAQACLWPRAADR